MVGSAEFVGWYNGHPDFVDLAPPLEGTHAAVIGNGNVALDCARILSKNHHEFEGSDIVGHALDALDKSAVQTHHHRRPARSAPNLDDAQGIGELGHLEAATPVVDGADFPPVEADDALEPGHRKSIAILREFAGSGPDASKARQIVFDFSPRPVRIEGDGRAERIIVERTVLDQIRCGQGHRRHL